MIKFKTLRWKNMLSTGNIFTEIFLDKTKTTLIIGENGAGKSTFLDALSYALYGKAFRDLPNPLLVNAITNRQMMVEVEFSVDGANYFVRRGMKPSVFEIHINGELLDQDAAANDYQRYLEKEVLKMNYKSFKQIVVLGKANFTPFMELKAKERGQVIEDVIDINVYTVMAALNDRLSNLTRDQLRSVSENMSQLKNELAVHQQYLITQQADVEKLVEKLQEQLDNTIRIREQLTNEIDAAREENANRVSLIADRSQKSNLLTELQNIERSIAHRIGEYKKEISFFHQHETCPTCEQQIDEEFKKNTIQERATQLVTLSDGVKDVKVKIHETSNRMEEIAAICDQMQATDFAIREKQVEIGFLNTKIEDLTAQISQQGSAIEHTNNDNVEVLSRAIRNESEVYDQLVRNKEVDEYTASMLRDTGIKAKMIKKYIPVINKLINEYLASMNFMISFELDENFNETIRSTYRDKFVYHSFSEGEKLRINLAILFTWRDIAKLRNSVSTNLLIMDEIFESSLDDAGVDDFFQIIEDITGDSNIFVISHKSQMFDKFRGAIRFEKKGNFSRIASDGA